MQIGVYASCGKAMATATVLSASIKSGFLRSLWRQAGGFQSASGVLLSDVLAAFQDQGFSAVKTGRLVVNSSGSGHSTSFEIPSVARRFTPDAIFELSEELFDIYFDALSTLGVDGTDPAGQMAIFNTMMADDRFYGVRQFQTDVTAIRYPNFGPTGSNQ